MRRRAVLGGLAALAAGTARAAVHPETVAEIPGPLLIEGIAHDGRRLYLGSIATRRIVALDHGRPRPLMPTPLGVFGLACDAERGRLWAATSDLGGRSELVEIDCARRVVVGRYAAGRPGAVYGDVALGADGAVYVSDSRGAVDRLRLGERRLASLVAPDRLKSPQGMVAMAGRLIVADYATGLHQIDLGSGALSPIEGGTLRGVDGLVGWKGGLIAIQNGASTPRIVHVRVDRGRLASADILYEGGVLIEPTLGTIVGDRLIFIGRSQWGEADAKGVVRAGAGPTRIMSLALPP